MKLVQEYGGYGDHRIHFCEHVNLRRLMSETH